MAVEKLTRALVRDHMASFIEIDNKDRDGVAWYAWDLSRMAFPQNATGEAKVFKFKSHQSAMNFALGWIRRNRPDLERAATQEAKDGIAYRASKNR